MNDSGTAVRKVLAREHAPLGDLLVIADDFALPFGKLRFREAGSHGGHNGLRSIVEEMGTEKFSRLRVGIGDPVRNGRDHVLSRFEPDEAERLDELLDAAADAVEAWARDGTSKAANRFNTFQLREADMSRIAPAGEIDGPPNEDGIRRTKTGWRRVLPFADRDRGRSGDRSAIPMPESTRPPLRGRRGRDRRIAERVAADFATRHAPSTGDEALGFDVAGVDAEVEAARREAAPCTTQAPSTRGAPWPRASAARSLGAPAAPRRYGHLRVDHGAPWECR